jgi:hypothetical protein
MVTIDDAKMVAADIARSAKPQLTDVSRFWWTATLITGM